MKAAEITLRRAQAGDAREVAALVDAAYTPWIPRIERTPMPMTLDYAEEIRNKDVTVAEQDGELAGVIVLATSDEGFLLFNVAVDPARKRTGVGRALLEFAESEALRVGFDSIYLFTHEKMTENLDLYARIGYVEYDRRPIEDFHVVFMRKPLEQDGRGAAAG